MNIFKLFGEISVNNSQANKAIDETSGHASTASKILGQVGTTAAKVGTTMIKTLAVGAAAAGTALVGLTKQAVSYYSDYEQLTGGVETLFGDAAGTVMAYANQAFSAAGLSANDYMETVTSFSAALIKSVNNDTEKAAEYANLALTDMSDNANKMGTDMTSIQNAYQGFAKQNYTMLDNLKLGYGGTQSEMKRLLKDAEKIQKANGKTVKYSINSYADIVEAIHVVQTEMGITGTTAEEAATTIQGSVGMMKAAWANFLTGMADSSQDFDALTTNLVNSVITVANNIVPRIIETVPRLVEGLATIGEALVGYLPDIVSGLLPSVVSGAVTLVSGLVTQIPELLTSIGDALITSWESTLYPMIQGVFKTAFGVDLPDWESLGATIAAGWEGQVYPQIQGFFLQQFHIELPDWNTLKSKATSALNGVSTSIKTNLTGAVNKLKTAFKTVTGAISSFVSWVTSGDTSAVAFRTTIVAVAAAVGVFAANMAIQGVISGVTNAISLAKNGFAAFNAVLSANPVLLIVAAIAALVAALVYLYNTNETVRNAIDNAWNAIKDVFNTVVGAIKGFIQGLIDTWNSWQPTIQAAWETIKQAFNDVCVAIVGFIQGIIETWNNWVPGIQAAWESVKEAFNTVLQPIKDAIQSVIDLWESWFPSEKSATVHVSSDGSSHGGNVGASFDVEPHAIGAVFNKPTIFDTRTGYHMVGEAGKEAVAPIDVLKDYVRDAVNEANGKNGSASDVALQTLVDNLPQMMVNAFASVKVDVNNREFARLVKAVT